MGRFVRLQKLLNIKNKYNGYLTMGVLWIGQNAGPNLAIVIERWVGWAVGLMATRVCVYCLAFRNEHFHIRVNLNYVGFFFYYDIKVMFGFFEKLKKKKREKLDLK